MKLRPSEGTLLLAIALLLFLLATALQPPLDILPYTTGWFLLGITTAAEVRKHDT